MSDGVGVSRDGGQTVLVRPHKAQLLDLPKQRILVQSFQLNQSN
jgi:hypothetical protein